MREPVKAAVAAHDPVPGRAAALYALYELLVTLAARVTQRVTGYVRGEQGADVVGV